MLGLNSVVAGLGDALAPGLLNDGLLLLVKLILESPLWCGCVVLGSVTVVVVTLVVVKVALLVVVGTVLYVVGGVLLVVVVEVVGLAVVVVVAVAVVVVDCFTVGLKSFESLNLGFSSSLIVIGRGLAASSASSLDTLISCSSGFRSSLSGSSS